MIRERTLRQYLMAIEPFILTKLDNVRLWDHLRSTHSCIDERFRGETEEVLSTPDMAATQLVPGGLENDLPTDTISGIGSILSHADHYRETNRVAYFIGFRPRPEDYRWVSEEDTTNLLAAITKMADRRDILSIYQQLVSGKRLTAKQVTMVTAFTVSYVKNLESQEESRRRDQHFTEQGVILIKDAGQTCTENTQRLVNQALYGVGRKREIHPDELTQFRDKVEYRGADGKVDLQKVLQIVPGNWTGDYRRAAALLVDFLNKAPSGRYQFVAYGMAVPIGATIRSYDSSNAVTKKMTPEDILSKCAPVK